MVVAAVVSLTGCAGGALAPRGSSATEIAQLWWLMLAAAALVYAVVLVIVVVALRRRAGRADPGSATRQRVDGRFIVWGGLVLPAVVLSVVLGATIATLTRLPDGDGTLDVHVTGNQYWWEVRYPQQGIVSANELHIPVGEDVRVHLTSDDVVHSFWVPELGGKRDLVPGRENVLVLDAEEPGAYRGQCAEFCGIQHANMAFWVIAHEREDFAAWADHAAEPAPEPTTAAARRGREEFEDAGCVSCHTVRGTSADGEVGPDLTHFAGRRTIGAGAVPNTRGHLGGWVVDSQTIKPGNAMPPQDVEPGRLDDLLDYLETLE